MVQFHICPRCKSWIAYRVIVISTSVTVRHTAWDRLLACPDRLAACPTGNGEKDRAHRLTPARKFSQ